MLSKISILVGQVGCSIWASPLVLFRHALMPSSHWFSSTQVKFYPSEVREFGHHNVGGKGPSRVEQEHSMSKVDDDQDQRAWLWQSVQPFYTPLVLLPHSSSVSSHGGCAVCYPLASTGWHPWHLQRCDLHPPPIACNPVGPTINEDIHTHYTLPGILPIFSGHSSWHPWQKL